MGFVIVTGLFSSQTHAQSSIQNYQFTQSVGTYNEITGGTILGSTSNDEQVFNNSTVGMSGPVTNIGFPIGFSFVYNNISYDRFAVSTNGYIKLGNGTFSIEGSVSSAFTQDYGDTTGLKQIIGALHGDLQGQTGSTLRYQTVGTAPNRELVVQWKKYKFWLADGSDSLNFQVRLKETGNAIELAYGNIVRNSTDKLISVGMIGNVRSEANMRRARIDSSDTWQTSTTSYSPFSKCDLRTAFKPENGLKYLLYGLPPIPNDLAVLGLQFRKDLEFGCGGTATETISMVVENRGTNPQTAAIYGLKVNGVTVGTNAIGFTPPLQPSERRVVALNQTVNLSAAGTYSFVAYTQLANDTGQYSQNDTTKMVRSFFAPLTSPAAPIKSQSEFSQRGWKFYNGFNKPKNSGSKFTTNDYFYSQTTAIQVSAFGNFNDTIKEWIVSPAFQPVNGQILKFRAAITEFDTTTNVTGIDDDQIKVMISTDCGATWQSLLTFNQASVSSGQLSKTKNGYSIPISATSPFQIGFYVYNNATNPENTYYFHLDDVTMSLGNAYDLAVRKIDIIGVGATNCSQTTFPVTVRIKNVGDSAVSGSPISLTINGAAPITQNFTFAPALQSGDSTDVTFPTVTLTPNSTYKVVATVRLPFEDGFSSGNDTASTQIFYVGSANPIALPNLIDFNDYPSGIPQGWLVDQGSFTDFRVRVRGVISSKSLSTSLYASNKSSFAIMPSTATLPADYAMTFAMRVVNDNGASYFFAPTDSIAVSITDNCGGTFTKVLLINAGNPFGANAFATATVDLSAYVGKSISIKFEVSMNRTDFTGAWLDIDNIAFAPNTAINSMILANGIQIFPNPAQEKLFIKNPLPTNIPFRLMDMNGKTIQAGEIRPGAENQEVNIQSIAPGMYMIQLHVEGKNTTKKVIIH